MKLILRLVMDVRDPPVVPCDRDVARVLLPPVHVVRGFDVGHATRTGERDEHQEPPQVKPPVLETQVRVGRRVSTGSIRDASSTSLTV